MIIACFYCTYGGPGLLLLTCLLSANYPPYLLLALPFLERCQRVLEIGIVLELLDAILVQLLYISQLSLSPQSLCLPRISASRASGNEEDIASWRQFIAPRLLQALTYKQDVSPMASWGCTAQGGVNPMEWQPAVQDDVCDLLEGIF